MSDNHIITYAFDIFDRATSVNSDLGSFDYTKQYSYISDGYDTSPLVGSYTSTVGSSSTTYAYGYDSRGNITVVEKAGVETVYTYDDLGQLTRESNGTTSRIYTYDNAGNIISIQSEPVSSDGGIIARAILPLPGLTTTTTLSYTNSQRGDLLTSYNGTAITYDAIGNPLTYYNGSAYTFTWTGRQLTGAVKVSKNKRENISDIPIWSLFFS